MTQAFSAAGLLFISSPESSNLGKTVDASAVFTGIGFSDMPKFSENLRDFWGDQDSALFLFLKMECVE